MSKQKFEMSPNITYSRGILATLMGKEDRGMRAMVRKQRREGIPIMAVKGGGYKIAETDAEKLQLLQLYRGRALDELTTYSKLLKSMQLDGQMTVQELVERVGEQ